MKNQLDFWPQHSETPDPDLTLKAIEAHTEAISKGKGVLKNEHKTAITKVEVDGKLLIVKQYRDMGVRLWLKGLFALPPARKSYRAAQEMAKRGIPAPKNVGLAESVRWGLPYESWLVVEGLRDATEMDLYMSQQYKGGGDRYHRRRFGASFAKAINALVESGIRHGDLKTCNILVQEVGDGWKFTFIDLDDVEIRPPGTPMSYDEWVLLLGQLNPSTLKDLPWTDRLLFLDQLPPVSSFDRRRLAADVQELSRKRRRCHFSVDGVVETDFV